MKDHWVRKFLSDNNDLCINQIENETRPVVCPRLVYQTELLLSQDHEVTTLI